MASQRKLGPSARLLAWTAAALAAFAPAASHADQLILDDLIVDGSTCVGLDCINDQPFGFTTLMLKENNVRILFQDTSVTSLFPKNDWEIIANDSIDGGRSFLGFADRKAGVVSVSGQGICEGGPDHGLVCGTGAGSACLGVCVGGTYDGFPCTPDPSYCSDGGGTCIDAGVCVAIGAIIFRIEAGGPEDSLVIDSDGTVHVAGDLTVEGTINGSGPVVEALQEEVEVLQAAIEELRSLPPLKHFFKD